MVRNAIYHVRKDILVLIATSDVIANKECNVIQLMGNVLARRDITGKTVSNNVRKVILVIAVKVFVFVEMMPLVIQSMVFALASLVGVASTVIGHALMDDTVLVVERSAVALHHLLQRILK